MAVVRGELATAGVLAQTAPEQALTVAAREGLVALVADRLTAQAAPEAIRAAFDQRARQLAAADLVREIELRVLVDALGAVGIPAVLFKGAHLAYACYERPDLRPRLDTDILVQPVNKPGAEALLLSHGYAKVSQFEGDLVSYQRSYTKRRSGEVAHVVDLHWRVVNPQRFAEVLTAEEVLSDSRPIGRLGGASRGPSPAHAMLLACVHPVAHHAGHGPLLWDCDVARLAEVMSPPDWSAYTELAIARGVAAICRARLGRAREIFDARVPSAVTDALAAHGPGQDHDDRSRRHIFAALSDATSLGNWPDRFRWARQHLFPSREYMREVYSPASRAPIGWLYARRAARGAMRWLRRT